MNPYLDENDAILEMRGQLLDAATYFAAGRRSPPRPKKARRERIPRSARLSLQARVGNLWGGGKQTPYKEKIL
jgi:hypothetical protein